MEEETIRFTREDVEKITRIDATLAAIDEKLDRLNDSINWCQGVCKDRREKFAKRVEELESESTENRGFLKGRKADLALVTSVLTLIVLVIAIVEKVPF